MRRNMFITCILVFLAGLTLLIVVTSTSKSEVEKELRKIKIRNISFFMTQEKVENMHGPGPDDTPGCFGCELNFIYPQLKLSGRYSDTLDRKNDYRKSPKVKEITTIDNTVKVFDIGVGETFEKAIDTLQSKGFTLQNNEHDYFYNYYFKDNVYIRLWADAELYSLKVNNNYLGKDNDIIKGITIEYRVREDEEIVY